MSTFVWPLLFILLPLPWVVYRFFPQASPFTTSALKVPHCAPFACLADNTAKSRSTLPFFLGLLTWICLLAAAARPQSHGSSIEIPQTGRDLMLAVDLSGSMQIQDFELNGRRVDRLSALKTIAGDFIERRKGDRMGLILFGSQAYLQTPLTFDTATVQQLLNEAEVGLAGNETAIGDAIGLAIKHLKNKEESSRVLILLTDGNSNAGLLTPEKAAEIAKNEKLKIHTIAIGADHFLVQTLFGSQKMKNEIDEKSLKMISEKTGGHYYRAYNTKELAQIYREIDLIERIERNPHYYRPVEEIYYWPLGAALISLSLWLVTALMIRKKQ